MSHIADLTDPAQVAGLFAAVEAQLGPVEMLVNNAGMVQTGKAGEAPARRLVAMPNGRITWR
jgi:NAD(P)-dependent dehydrogenase (short-subunit alcohol dehydrogenase family)